MTGIEWLLIIIGILVVKYLLIWRFWPRRPKVDVQVGMEESYSASNLTPDHWTDSAKLQKEYEKGEKTANQVRAEMGYPSIGPSGDIYITQMPELTVNQGIEEAIAKAEAHKHMFRLSGVSPVGDGNYQEISHNHRLIFRCYGGGSGRCWSPTVRIPRWKWNEMTRDFREVDQVWPG